MLARHTHDPYSTHQPVLFEALLRTDGPVIEFGCGHGSTVMLHHYCQEHGRKLITLDSDREWIRKFDDYATSLHWIIYVSSWDSVLEDTGILGTPWDVVFIDQEPWEARYSTIQALKDVARFIVLHDCDYFPEHGIFGMSLEPLRGSGDRGLRTYYDVFKHYEEFFPLEPWPYPPTGPPTLLASNFERCDWDVDFEKYRLAESLVMT